MKSLFQNMAREIIAYIAQMIAKWLVFMAITGGQGGAFAAANPFKFAAEGAVIREPSIVTGMRSGKQTVMGEAGPEAIVPANSISQGADRVAAAMGAGDNGGGGSLTVNVNISGQFIEADSATWQSLIRDKIVPEIRRFTMSTPVGPFTRRRGAVA